MRAVYLSATGAAAGVMLLSACASATIEDAVPRAALEAGETGASQPDETPDAVEADANALFARESRASDGSRYPNLNIPPGVAAEQISDAQRADTVKALRQARSRQGEPSNGRAAAGEAADRLRRLRQFHGAEVLKAIEADEEEATDKE